MGIRINTVMGWGFQKCRYGRDPRFNSKIFSDSEIDYLPKMLEINKADKLKEVKWHREDFMNWVDGKMSFEKTKKSKIEQVIASDFIHYNYYNTEDDEESLSSGPIVITNPEIKQWSRHDDSIDYYMAPKDKNGDYSDSVKLILDGAGQPAQIYPYCAFVNRKTGEHVKVTQSDRWSLTNLYFTSTKAEKKKWKWEKMSEIFCGAKNIIEWQRDIVPEPPYIIRLFCEASNLFKNPMTVYRLKPMVITYWC